MMYDLIINTRTLTVDDAAELVKSSIEYTKILSMTAATERSLSDICLSQEVISRIRYIEKIPVDYFEVTSDNGVVTIRGTVPIKEYVKNCESIAGEVPGVKKVINNIVFYILNPS
jgi:osmotically-inducible protein OsmY